MKGFARLASLLGHPLLFVPVMVLARSTLSGAGALPGLNTVILVLAIAACVLGYSVRQVRRGDWVDLDASQQGERPSLLLVSGLCLSVATLAGWGLGAEADLISGLASAFLIVLAAALSASWIKLSLHAAFAVYAAFLFWPIVPLVLAVMALAVIIGWSRVALRRHSKVDVAAGFAAGLAASVLRLIMS